MRILHTEWSDGLGGQEKRILLEATGLAERGHEVTIVCREEARIKKEALRQGIEVETLPFRRLYDIESILRLYAFIKKKRSHVVNTHSGIDSWIGGIAARLAGVPLLVRTRHLNIPLRRNILNFIHYLPDVYITCGEDMRQNLINKCGFPFQKVVSVPTGIEPVFFDIKRDSEAKVKYGLNSDNIVVTNVGILRKVKGHEVTLRSVKRVIGSFPHVRFLIVGDGPRREHLEEMVNELGISGYVLFTGFIENVAEVYSFTDVAILSSWSEGLPQSLLHAMAAGVPVVATKVGGVPEVVIHEETGILIEPGDSESLSKGIIRVLKDPLLREHMVSKAREIIKSRYTIDHMLDKTESLYRELLSRKTRCNGSKIKIS